MKHKLQPHNRPSISGNSFLHITSETRWPILSLVVHQLVNMSMCFNWLSESPNVFETFNIASCFKNTSLSMFASSPMLRYIPLKRITSYVVLTIQVSNSTLATALSNAASPSSGVTLPAPEPKALQQLVHSQLKSYTHSQNVAKPQGISHFKIKRSAGIPKCCSLGEAEKYGPIADRYCAGFLSGFIATIKGIAVGQGIFRSKSKIEFYIRDRRYGCHRLRFPLLPHDRMVLDQLEKHTSKLRLAYIDPCVNRRTRPL